MRRGENIFIYCVFIYFYFNWIFLLKFKEEALQIKTKGDKKEPVQGYSSNLISCNPVAEAPNAQKERDAQTSLSFPVYGYYSQNSQTHFSVAGRRRQFKFEPPSPVSTVQLLSWSD